MIIVIPDRQIGQRIRYVPRIRGIGSGTFRRRIHIITKTPSGFTGGRSLCMDQAISTDSVLPPRMWKCRWGTV